MQVRSSHQFRFGLLAFALLLFAKGFGQSEQPISIGHTRSLHSDVLSEDRNLWIYLPQSARVSKDRRYPVVFLLDGETLFHPISGVLSHLSEVNGNAFVPEMILVGIGNTNRNRDLTPSLDSSSGLPETGGGPAFMAFLEKELIPYIDSNYATHPYRLLIGHSLGGLMVMHAYAHHPQLFDAYLALDPSIWWDNMRVLQELEEALDNGVPEGKRLFLAQANSLPQGMSVSEATSDTSSGTLGLRSVLALEKLLKAKAEGMVWKSKYFPEDSHGSIPLPGTLEGLRFLFDYYRRPSFAVITDETPRVLEKHYERVSRELGYEIPPPQRTLVGLAWRSRALEGRNDRALAFLKMAEKYYPEGIDVHYEWAAYYQAMGNQEKLEYHYLKAQALEAGK